MTASKLLLDIAAEMKHNDNLRKELTYTRYDGSQHHPSEDCPRPLYAKDGLECLACRLSAVLEDYKLRDDMLKTVRELRMLGRHFRDIGSKLCMHAAYRSARNFIRAYQGRREL